MTLPRVHDVNLLFFVLRNSKQRLFKNSTITPRYDAVIINRFFLFFAITDYP